LHKAYTVRHIEFMPSGGEEGDWRSQVVPGREILDRIANRFTFDEIDRRELAGPAKAYRESTSNLRNEAGADAAALECQGICETLD